MLCRGEDYVGSIYSMILIIFETKHVIDGSMFYL